MSGSGKAGKSKGADKAGEPKLVAENRKARFEYEVMETFEAGLVLRGTEVKALRAGKMSLDESYARVHDGEMFLVGANIPEYAHGNLQNHEPKRRRKCLLHAREIRKMQQRSQVEGLTLIPLRIYFSARGLAKVAIGICRGRKIHDKREHLRTKEHRRELRDS